jgi:hypothetical protein
MITELFVVKDTRGKPQGLYTDEMMARRHAEALCSGSRVTADEIITTERIITEELFWVTEHFECEARAEMYAEEDRLEAEAERLAEERGSEE